MMPDNPKLLSDDIVQALGARQESFDVNSISPLASEAGRNWTKSMMKQLQKDDWKLLPELSPRGQKLLEYIRPYLESGYSFEAVIDALKIPPMLVQQFFQELRNRNSS